MESRLESLVKTLESPNADNREGQVISVAVVIVAAGRGRRLGGETPKQYLPLAGRTPLRLSIEAFLAIASVSHIIAVVHPDDLPLYNSALAEIDDPRLMLPVYGGETRAASVAQGLDALVEAAPEKVLVHDAARPFISLDAIRSVIDVLETHDGAAVGLPVVDAIWRANSAGRLESVQRDSLWRAQTPQGFRFDKILEAHRHHDGSAADDVAVAVEAGLAVQFVTGSEQNYKITTADDYVRAEADAVRLGLEDT